MYALHGLRSAVSRFRTNHHPHWLTGSQHLAHLSYFALVFIEGHSTYAYAAGVLLVLGVTAIIVGETPE